MGSIEIHRWKVYYNNILKHRRCAALYQKRLEKHKMARTKKSEPVESPVTTAVEAVKETVTARKAAAKKTPAKDAKRVEEVYLQASGAEWNVTECRERAVAAYVEMGHRASSVKKLVVYLKPEEGKGYYVVNDGESGDFDL